MSSAAPTPMDYSDDSNDEPIWKNPCNGKFHPTSEIDKEWTNQDLRSLISIIEKQCKKSLNEAHQYAGDFVSILFNKTIQQISPNSKLKR